MPPKAMTKTTLGRLTKPVLLNMALSLGLIQGKKPMLKEEIINFILYHKTDEMVAQFTQLSVSQKSNIVVTPTPDSGDCKKTVTFNDTILCESLLPSVLSTIVETKSILKVDVISEAKKCKTLEEILQLLQKYPEYSKNKEIKKIIKNLPDSDSDIDSVDNNDDSKKDSIFEIDVPNHPEISNQEACNSLAEQDVEPRSPTADTLNVRNDVIEAHIPATDMFKVCDDVVESHIPATNKLHVDIHFPTTKVQEYVQQEPESLDLALEEPPEEKFISFAQDNSVQIPKKECEKKKKQLIEQIKNAKDITDILKTIKNPNEVHISSISDVDYEIAKAFGFIF